MCIAWAAKQVHHVCLPLLDLCFACWQATNRLAVGYVDSTINVYDLYTASKIKSFKAHGKVSCLAFFVTGDMLASYTATEAVIQTWQVRQCVKAHDLLPRHTRPRSRLLQPSARLHVGTVCLLSAGW